MQECLQNWQMTLPDLYYQRSLAVVCKRIYRSPSAVAILALLMGIAIGVLVAIVRTKHDSRKKNAHGFGNVILNILNANLSGLSDHYPGNPYDGSADDHVFRSIFIQPT